MLFIFENKQDFFKIPDKLANQKDGSSFIRGIFFS
jgi:hypothetical protein